MRPRRVLVISASDTKGGSNRVAYYLASGLVDSGIEVEMLVGERNSPAGFVRAFPPADTRRGLAERIVHRLGYDGLALTSPLPRRALTPEYLDRFDVIHLHDLPRGFNHIDLWRLFRRRRLVWTIHSMAPLTGNCIYPYDCTRWRVACGQCPQHGRWPLLWHHRDGSRGVLSIKRQLYRRLRLHAVGVSDWVTARIAESIMGGASRSTVHNPSWRTDFFPVDRQAARSRLGVPRDAFAIMFALPRTLLDARKGADLIIAAARALRGTGTFLLPTGITEQDGEAASAFDGIDGLPSAHLTTPEALRDHYAAADVVWHPSRADTSSMVSLEAFGCGTPVIAADVGGVGEIVEHERSGLLVPPGDAGALERATRRIMGDGDLLARLRDGARARAAAFSPERFIDGYARVYADVLRT